MEQPDRVTDLFLAVMDFWEMKGGEKVNPELADIIELHLGMAYTSGAEDFINKLSKMLDEEHERLHPGGHRNISIAISHIKNFIRSYEIN